MSKVSEDLRRRYLASLRLPPMKCGCHDPESPRHLRGDCRTDRPYRVTRNKRSY